MINCGCPRPSLAVIFIFTSIRATTHAIRLPGKHYLEHSSFSCPQKVPPHDWDSILLSSPSNSSSKWSKTGKNSKKPVKIRYNFFFLINWKKKFVTLTIHVLRSVCPNGSQKQMHLACLSPHPK
jgi:hypothetical protein